MATFDLPLGELRAYRPERDEPADFADFWIASLDRARHAAPDATFTPYDAGLSLVDTYDVRFAGFGGDRVAGWFIVPRGADRPLPAAITYLGYGEGRGLPYDWLMWPAAGYATFVMDTRGQGTGRRAGSTGDPAGGGYVQVPGFMTRGLVDAEGRPDPAGYYYHRVYVDAVLALDVVRQHPLVDPARIVVSGGSQGGAITQAVAGLAGLTGIPLAGAVVNVPFLCQIRRATEITDAYPYHELVRFFASNRQHVDAAFTTLSYVDGTNFAPRAAAPALYSVALMDDICPPSTVFAAYNWYAGPKRIDVYPYNEHEGGGMVADERALRFAAEVIAG